MGMRMLARGGAIVGGVGALAQWTLCERRSPLDEPSRARSRAVGMAPTGAPVIERTLTNGPLQVKVLDWGATITSVRTPDRHGKVGEVTLGYDEPGPYMDGSSPYFGCVAGRVANRIARGAFSLDGAEYKLAQNNGPNHLHGGAKGFDKQLWFCEEQTPTSLSLALLSPDGDEGYPGTVLARVKYSLPTPTTLRIDYAATTDRPTPVNLTNHCYWNLASGGSSSILGHEIAISADYYTPVDEGAIPTGEVKRVEGTPMDLRKPVPIGDRIKGADNGGGFDHNYVLRSPTNADGLRPAARVFDPESGRSMTVRTDQKGVQFYSGNFLSGEPGRGKLTYQRHAGLCLETQAFPDSVNHAHFPSIVLRPAQTYTHTTVHEFGASGMPPQGPF